MLGRGMLEAEAEAAEVLLAAEDGGAASASPAAAEADSADCAWAAAEAEERARARLPNGQPDVAADAQQALEASRSALALAGELGLGLDEAPPEEEGVLV